MKKYLQFFRPSRKLSSGEEPIQDDDIDEKNGIQSVKSFTQRRNTQFVKTQSCLMTNVKVTAYTRKQEKPKVYKSAKKIKNGDIPKPLLFADSPGSTRNVYSNTPFGNRTQKIQSDSPVAQELPEDYFKKGNRCQTPNSFKEARANRLEALKKISSSPMMIMQNKKKKNKIKTPVKSIVETFTPASKRWMPEENINSSQLIVNSEEDENSAFRKELTNKIDQLGRQLQQQKQEYYQVNPGEILEQEISSFDYTVFAQLGEINEDQEQQKKEMHRSFQKFCLLLIILHGKLPEYLFDKEGIQNEFLKKLNVFEVIKGLKDLIEKQDFEVKDLQDCFPENYNYPENKLMQFTVQAVKYAIYYSQNRDTMFQDYDPIKISCSPSPFQTPGSEYSSNHEIVQKKNVSPFKTKLFKVQSVKKITPSLKKSVTMNAIEQMAKNVKPIKSKSAQKITPVKKKVPKPKVEVKLTPNQIKPKQDIEFSPKFTEEKTEEKQKAIPPCIEVQFSHQKMSDLDQQEQETFRPQEIPQPIPVIKVDIEPPVEPQIINQFEQSEIFEIKDCSESMSMRSSMLTRRSKQDRKLQKNRDTKKSGQPVKEISLFDLEDVEQSIDIEKKRKLYLDQLKDESIQSAQEIDQKIQSLEKQKENINNQVRENQKKVKQNLIYLALIEVEEQILDDPDIENGMYFWQMKLCPKSDREAVLMEAKQCESVIKEESEDDISMQSIQQ